MSDWLSENEISITKSPWFTDTYHLTIDGNVFSDRIAINITNNGTVASCVLNIKRYESTAQKLSLVNIESALENVFFIDNNDLLTNEKMYVANVQVMHINGLPMYFFMGSPVEGDNVSNASIEGYAFAFVVDDTITAQVSSLVDSLIDK